MKYRSSVISLAVLFFMQSFSTSVSADVVRLKNGGEVRGQLEASSAQMSEPLVVRTLSGAVVEIDREETDFVQRRSRVMEEYVSKSRSLTPSIDSHWQLAEWCRSHRLKNQRSEQLELLLQLEPDHEDARKILGHVKHHGEWMPREEMMAKQGYVKYRNQWITSQELALIEKNAKQREAELVWYPKVRLWLGWIHGNDHHRKKEGLNQFSELREPDAVPALMKMMATHDDLETRRLYVRVLGQIPGSGAVEALLDRYLYDPSEAVWSEALLAIQPGQYELAIPMLISALTNDSNSVIQRAASALGNTGSEQAVPALIAALITTHKLKVEVVDSQPISFGRSSSGSVGMVDPRQANGAAMLELEMLARLGQLPYGARIVPFYQTPKNTKVVTVVVDVKNAAVLTALEKITDKHLGYNESDWHLWWSVYKS